MLVLRTKSVWLPRIMAAMLLVFTIDVAVAASCCPLNAGIETDSAAVNSTMPDGAAACPQSDDSSGQMGHDTCCLACVVMLPVWEIPVIDTVAQSFSSPFTYVDPSAGLEPPYRPPIKHLR